MKNKTKNLRAVLLCLACLLVFCAFAGCKQEAPDTSASLVTRFEPMKDTDDKIAFVAEQRLGHIAMSAWFSLEISVDNGRIYVNDKLYDAVTYTENFDLVYSEGLLLAEKNAENAMANTLEEIKAHGGCYLLEMTDQDGKIAVYELNDTFYFITFGENGEAIRVHSANIK